MAGVGDNSTTPSIHNNCASERETVSVWAPKFHEIISINISKKCISLHHLCFRRLGELWLGMKYGMWELINTYFGNSAFVI